MKRRHEQPLPIQSVPRGLSIVILCAIAVGILIGVTRCLERERADAAIVESER